MCIFSAEYISREYILGFYTTLNITWVTYNAGEKAKTSAKKSIDIFSIKHFHSRF